MASAVRFEAHKPDTFRYRSTIIGTC